METENPGVWENDKKNTLWRKMKEALSRQPSPPLKVPQIVGLCPGIPVGGALIRSAIFSTDLAIIENTDCQAIFAVYPFSPSERIIRGLVNTSGKPVFCGIGGGLTRGKKSMYMAEIAEQAGAKALIVNQPFPGKVIRKIFESRSLPVISTVADLDYDISARIRSGVAIIHVAAGLSTPALIEKIKRTEPAIPVMATGGKNIEHLTDAVNAGADAIVLTPPTTGELFRNIMMRYRMGMGYKK